MRSAAVITLGLLCASPAFAAPERVLDKQGCRVTFQSKEAPYVIKLMCRRDCSHPQRPPWPEELIEHGVDPKVANHYQRLEMHHPGPACPPRDWN
jgi:hypothetical protein